MATDPQLIKDWIQYLKNNQIAAMQSDPKTGQLKYKRPVTSDDLFKFLNGIGKFDEDQIKHAIESVVSKKGQAQQQPAEQPPAQQPTAQPPAQQPTAQPGQKRTPSQTPDAIRKRKSRADATQKSKTGNAVMQNMVNQLHEQYNALMEDIKDTPGPQIDEKDVEAVIDLLSAGKSNKQNGGTPAQQTQSATPDKQESIKKIKKLIRDSMNPQQRKTFYRALNEQ